MTAADQRRSSWRNWSGSATARPRELLTPRDEQEVVRAVAAATEVRVTGAGHSFAPLCTTDGTLLDLRLLAGQLEVLPEQGRVWAPAGWSIAKLTHALWEHGYSLANQGDVNPQAIAGALATGTHGTGAELGSLSTLVHAFRLLLADGTVVQCSRDEHPELFQAQRLSLGLCGVVLAVCLEVMPAYRLEERIVAMPLAEVVQRFAELATRSRHVEFWAFPYADSVILKTLHPTDDLGRFKQTPAYEELALKLVCEVSAHWPAATRAAQRAVMRLVTPSRRVGPAYQIFPSERRVRFEEMEYELPRTAAMAALQEAISWVRRERAALSFPFEFRWTAGDDIWLSPFNRGPCASVSTHQYVEQPWRELFSSLEPIFRAHAGRPHWGKRHTLRARDVFELYPDAARFCETQTRYDPQGKFVNRYLRELFALPEAR